MITRFVYSSLSVFFFFGIFLYFTDTPSAHAQLSPFSSGLQLSTDPEFPEPNSTVGVYLDDYSLDTLGATIQWFVDGVEKVDSRNSRSIQIQTGTLGKKQAVRVMLSRSNAPALSQSITIIPTLIDIIIEADTYIPSFYKGRALPSSQAPVRVIAVVHDIPGSNKNEYSYKWSEDASVLLGGPVKGRNVLVYQMPQFADSELTVEVFNADGASVGRKRIPFEPVEPQLHFYESNSLRGLGERAVSSPFTLIANETVLYGEPYFFNTRLKDPKTLYTWELDGNEIAHDPIVPNAITLKKDGDAGEGTVSLQVVFDTVFPQYVGESLNYIF